MGRIAKLLLFPAIPVAAHFSASREDALILVFIVAFALLFRSGIIRYLAALALVAVTGAWWLQLRWVFPLAYGLPLVVFLMMATVFASTLQPGKEALVTRIARAMGDDITPELARYTQAVTQAWVVLFLVLTVVSLALALWGSVLQWSLFTNLLSYLFIVLMFVLEFYLRPLFVKPAVKESFTSFIRRMLLVMPGQLSSMLSTQRRGQPYG